MGKDLRLAILHRRSPSADQERRSGRGDPPSLQQQGRTAIIAEVRGICEAKGFEVSIRDDASRIVVTPRGPATADVFTHLVERFRPKDGRNWQMTLGIEGGSVIIEGHS